MNRNEINHKIKFLSLMDLVQLQERLADRVETRGWLYRVNLEIARRKNLGYVSQDDINSVTMMIENVNNKTLN